MLRNVVPREISSIPCEVEEFPEACRAVRHASCSWVIAFEARELAFTAQRSHSYVKCD